MHRELATRPREEKAPLVRLETVSVVPHDLRTLHDMSFEDLENAKDVVFALSDEKDWTILSSLSRHRELSFSKLCKATTLRKPLLTRRLKKLLRAGLIENIYTKKEDTAEYSFYRLAQIGIEFLLALTWMMNPERFEVPTDILLKAVLPNLSYDLASDYSGSPRVDLSYVGSDFSAAERWLTPAKRVLEGLPLASRLTEETDYDALGIVLKGSPIHPDVGVIFKAGYEFPVAFIAEMKSGYSRKVWKVYRK
ncbi:MAG: MarR family transcriptional regulator [Thermoplasmata archaeon]|nr:MarR family transcriptional regulator [Thermoplasmata archaeon]